MNIYIPEKLVIGAEKGTKSSGTGKSLKKTEMELLKTHDDPTLRIVHKATGQMV